MRPEARSLGTTAAVGLAIAVAVLMLVPFEPAFSPSNSTTGWPTRIAADLAEQRRFGVETVFSYGPLGLIPIRFYYPGTYATLLLGSVLIASAFVGSSLSIFRNCGNSPLASSLLTLIVAAIVTSQLSRVGTEPLFNVLVAFVPLLAIARRDKQGSRWLDALLGVALATAGLGKFNYFVAAVGVISVGALIEVKERRAPITGMAFLSAIPVLWLYTGQSLSDLAPFLSSSLDLLRGYSEAMSLESQSRDAVGFVAAAALIAATFPLLVPPRERVVKAMGIAVSWAFWCFIVLKSAVVRQDEHVLSAALSIVAASVLLWATVRDGSTLKRSATAASTTLALTGVIVSLASFGASPSSELGSPLRLLRVQLAALGRTLVDRGWLERRHRSSLASARALTPLPPTSGTIDFLPNSSIVPLAHGLPQSPNPIVMSYTAACAPRLSELQARHLRLASGPRNLVLSLETIDERYPSLDLGPSLLEILARYEPSGQVGQQDLLVTRRERPRPLTLERILMRQALPGEEIELGQAVAGKFPIWARVTVQSATGRAVVSALYRSPVFTLRATLKGGGAVENRFIPASGETGFLLSPYLRNRNSLAALHSGASEQLDSVTSFSVDVEPTILPVMSSVSVELFKITEVK